MDSADVAEPLNSCCNGAFIQYGGNGERGSEAKRLRGMRDEEDQTRKLGSIGEKYAGEISYAIDTLYILMVRW